MFEWLYLVLISSVFMGVSTIIEKYTLKDEHASVYSSSFALITFILSLIFLPFANFHIPIIDIIYIYINALLSTITYLLTARVFKHGNLSISAPVLSSLPMAFIVIISLIALNEKLTLLQYAALAIIIVSSYFIVFKSGKKGIPSFDNKKYAYMLIIISFIMGISTVLMKYIFIEKVNVFTFLILAEFFISMNYLIYMSIRYGGIKEVYGNVKNYKKKIGTISVLTIIYRVTYYFSASLMLISIVAPIRNSIYVIITALFGGIIFKEQGLKRKMFIIVIMLIAVYYISISVG